MPLSKRQSEILKAIIEEHIECAQPVASVELVEKRHLQVSGATVRNVMADLVKLGYLEMMHVSSGRIPTDRAYRLYITELMDEDELNVLDEVAIKQKVWEQRYEIERLLRNSSIALSEIVNSLAVALTTDGFITYAGTSKIFDIPEFYEIDVTKAVFRIIDDYELAKSIFEKAPTSNGISILIGREIGLANTEPVSVISAKCMIAGRDCYIGVVGPARFEYEKVIPTVRYISHLLEEVGESI